MRYLETMVVWKVYGIFFSFAHRVPSHEKALRAECKCDALRPQLCAPVRTILGLKTKKKIKVDTHPIKRTKAQKKRKRDEDQMQCPKSHERLAQVAFFRRKLRNGLAAPLVTACVHRL